MAILGTALAEIARGHLLYGAFCLLALALTSLPAVPLGLQLALLGLMIMDMTLGNTLGLYTQLPWFDKLLHLSGSILLGVIAFLAVYVLHLTGRTRFRPWLDGVAILLVTLGLGAAWEIAEYAVHIYLARDVQGSPMLSAHDDTMTDLVMDAVGGVLGAVGGAAYIKRSRRSRRRMAAFAREVGRRERYASSL